jgi:hypothetical protein
LPAHLVRRAQLRPVLRPVGLPRPVAEQRRAAICRRRRRRRRSFRPPSYMRALLVLACKAVVLRPGLRPARRGGETMDAHALQVCVCVRA